MTPPPTSDAAGVSRRSASRRPTLPSRRRRRCRRARRAPSRPARRPAHRAPRRRPDPVTDRRRAGAAWSTALAAGTGPVAVDAERASGYRYGQRAYLVQLRRAGAGTVLIDPRRLPDLAALGAAIGRRRVGAARRVPGPALPGRARPAARRGSSTPSWPAGCWATPRVGLGAIVEEVLGLTLEKGHSAADWSTRPLPEPWLRYAALDVEVLVELRDALAAQLDEQGKRDWAEQEFAAIVAAPPPPPRVDPWRRTSGLHRVRKRRQLAVVRALWERRDEVARRRDIAPGRVLPDAAIVAAALAQPRDRGGPGRAAGLGRPVDAPADRDLAAGHRRRPWRCRTPSCPSPRRRTRGRRRPASWARPRPGRGGPAGGRPGRGRRGGRASTGLPVENLLAPDTVRRLCLGPARPDADAERRGRRPAGARRPRRGRSS